VIEEKNNRRIKLYWNNSRSKREAIRNDVLLIELGDRNDLINMFKQLKLGLKSKTTFDIDYEFLKNLDFLKLRIRKQFTPLVSLVIRLQSSLFN